MAAYLNTCTKTLRNLHRDGVFTDGVHVRRVNPLSRSSPYRWHRDLCNQVLLDLQRSISSEP